MLKLAKLELICLNSTLCQVSGTVLLFLLTVKLYYWKTNFSMKLTGGRNMKKDTSKTSSLVKLKLLLISVITTIHAILSSFLGESPMLA